ncbi:ketohexokinase [Scaptodrosophila lebanonensis]|uniref:Ketohexokinase n=1 Tax=Drosophila lebanonensis TaxID=7225 RepID=A0A6J2TAH2_DROLE|nr:ketohexokinase [Scaptodrosophila lebanonensis]
MKKQIVKEFITVKKVRYLPREPEPPPPPPKRHILVVGRYTLDVITVCDTFPNPGETHRITKGTWRRGGSASNICTVIRRLGAQCEFLGHLSNAPAFEGLISSFIAMGIDISSCPRSPKDPPHQSIIVVASNGTRTTIEQSTSTNELTFQQFLGAVDYQKYSWIHFECRNAKETKHMITAVRNYNARCGDHIIISVDLPNLRNMCLLLADLADYVFVRKQVMLANAYINGHETVCAIREMLRSIRSRWMSLQPKKTPYLPDDETSQETKKCEPDTKRVPIIIYANNIEGASCLLADDTYFKVSGHVPTRVLDTVGEHDAFCGAVIYAMHEIELSLRDAMEYGTRATSVKVAQNGFDGLRCIPKDLKGFYYL